MQFALLVEHNADVFMQAVDMNVVVLATQEQHSRVVVAVAIFGEEIQRNVAEASRVSSKQVVVPPPPAKKFIVEIEPVLIDIASLLTFPAAVPTAEEVDG